MKKRYIPSYIDVFGRKIRVSVIKDLGELRAAHGLYVPKTKEILFDEETVYGEKELAFVTIIHEIVHSLEDRLHLNIPHDLSDVVADAVGTVIVENFEIQFKRKK